MRTIALVGVAVFAVSGAQVAPQEGHSAVMAVLMGTITGVAAGVVRDVLLAEIPLVLRPEHLNPTAAIAGIAVCLLLLRLPVAPAPPDQVLAPRAERSNS